MPFFFKSAAGSGTGLVIETAGVGAGLAVGALLMHVGWDQQARTVVSVAGAAYFSGWVLLTAVRMGFA